MRPNLAYASHRGVQEEGSLRRCRSVKHHVKAILGKTDAIRCDGADAMPLPSLLDAG